MATNIIIIHHSEIVRCGLGQLIHKHYRVEPLLLERPQHLADFVEGIGQNAVFLIEQGDHKLVTELLKNTQKSMCIYGILTKGKLDEKSISLYSSWTEIDQLIGADVHRTNQKKTLHDTSLSDRESEVIRLVAMGKTNKEIAEELFISIHTVISHRKNITEKLGIKSISGLTVYAMLNHLIDASNLGPEDLI